MALALVLLLAVTRPALIDTLAWNLFDTYQQLKPRGDFDSPIRIIDIDEESLQRLGQWPWGRDQVASIVERLSEAGAAAIVFDIVFAEPDRTSPERVLQRLKQTRPDLDIALPTALPDNDQILEAAFAKGPVVAGMILSGQKNSKEPVAKAGFAFAGSDPSSYLPDYSGAITNIGALENAASGVGFVNYRPTRDRVIRTAPLIGRKGDQLYPSLAAEALRVAQGASTIQVRSTGASGETQIGDDAGVVAVKIGEFTVPTTAEGEMWIHFTNGPDRNVLPAWEVAQNDVNMESLRSLIEGHIVLIGTSAAGLLDIVATPLSASVPGVFVQAEIIDQILDGAFLVRPDWAPGAEQFISLIIGLLLILFLPRHGPGWGALIGATAIALVMISSWLAFSQYNLLLSPVYAALCVVAVYIATTGVLFLATEKERQSIRSAFGLYLAPALVKRLAEEPDQLKLGGEDRELTIMFSDIRGFTTLSEGLKPQELTSLINDFLTPMSDELLAGGATIDKYIGDAIMAFWNAPLPTDQHASHACRTVLRMIDRLDEVRAKIGRPLDIGIGLNTGVCCVGNLGSAQRFNYSAIGDCVNLASRIESLTKRYGVSVLVGQSTAQDATDHAFFEADQVRVMGKTEPVRIHALLGGPEMKADPGFGKAFAANEAMLAEFRAGRWAEADRLLSELELAAAALPVQSLIKIYRDRISRFRVDPPAAWDGTIDMDSK
ncbi:adenylate cyclase [Rhodoligotrophos appendicifer]|uniref:CHASE2 domain-containing protein n=1 Tax=Rhodoligotrophos appendicifer TaxID=987056 RepID=UPI001478684D|nr:adenylate/guanylate cyclase domain-containing protein [Rhodoligotrophos appendicifer]